MSLENFCRGTFWRTIQVKAIGEKNLANKLKSVNTYAKYIFGVSVNIGEENFGE